MWYHEHVGVGDRVARADNPRHEGRVTCVQSTGFVVLWECGWREECSRDELVVTAKALNLKPPRRSR